MKAENQKLMIFKVNLRLKLVGLWCTLMLFYIYCDIYSLHRPGYINEMTEGLIGPFHVNQEVLAVLGLLMVIPALMIPACLYLKARIAKWSNIVVGALYTLVNIGNLLGETWAYYWIYGILEIAVTIGIMITATKWDKEDINND